MLRLDDGRKTRNREMVKISDLKCEKTISSQKYLSNVIRDGRGKATQASTNPSPGL